MSSGVMQQKPFIDDSFSDWDRFRLDFIHEWDDTNLTR